VIFIGVDIDGILTAFVRTLDLREMPPQCRTSSSRLGRLQSRDSSVRPESSPQPGYHVPAEASPLVLTSYRHTFPANIQQQWATFALKLLFRNEHARGHFVMVKRDLSDVFDGSGDLLARRHLAPQHHQHIDIRARFRIAAGLRSIEAWSSIKTPVPGLANTRLTPSYLCDHTSTPRRDGDATTNKSVGQPGCTQCAAILRT
jgi:hypothetical protein